VDCGTSLPEFTRAIGSHEICAVAVSQDSSNELHVVNEVRSIKPVPVIVFARVGAPEHFPDVDLVIPALTPPPNWLKQIADLLQKSHQIAEQSATIRLQSAALRQQSAALRAQSASERERAAGERAKPSLDANHGKKHGFRP
jgi:hypothetical protein